MKNPEKSELESDELHDSPHDRCAKGMKISNGFVFSGLLIGIASMSIFGIIFAYYILVFFGVPLEVIYVFMILLIIAFISITIGTIIVKSRCDTKEALDVLMEQ